MKINPFIILLLLILSIAVSCAPQKEVVRPPEVPPVIVEKPRLVVVPPPVVKYKSSLRCEEKTEEFFNSSGIDVLPFIRVVFSDVDGDGKTEMIAGSKDGFLRLYRNDGSKDVPHWRLEGNYFDGIKVGAFSVPAAGDIDGDGRIEILVGTGGFSNDSGKVIAYKNAGSAGSPVWKRMDTTVIDVGDDATPALFDVDSDGKADLIVGNSTGTLALYRSRNQGKGIAFVKDAGYFKGIDLGMYVVPAVVSYKNKIVVIAGNSMGKMYVLEKGSDSSSSWQKRTLPFSFSSFASPTFIRNGREGVMDLVISDGNGQLTYFRNSAGDYRDWKSSDEFFRGRILAGPASAPVITKVNGSSFMVVGNKDGEIRLFMFEPSSKALPWVEKRNVFNGIKLSSFSRGILTEWSGRLLLITGQQDGIMRAFINTGSLDRPSWSEKKNFFRGIPKILHAAPAVFDIDGDGKWELIMGDCDGYVKGFRYETGSDGNPAWKNIDKIFDSVKVGRFASPSLLGNHEKTYLFVGQQDGRIIIYTADANRSGVSAFSRDESLQGVQVSNHSCPAVYENPGYIELTVGDYDGNLKHFACQTKKEALSEN
jgi:hypothetical protein